MFTAELGALAEGALALTAACGTPLPEKHVSDWGSDVGHNNNYC